MKKNQLHLSFLCSILLFSCNFVNQRDESAIALLQNNRDFDYTILHLDARQEIKQASHAGRVLKGQLQHFHKMYSPSFMTGKFQLGQATKHFLRSSSGLKGIISALVQLPGTLKIRPRG